MANHDEAAFEGNANVFVDLGLPNPDERSIKARLASKIFDGIEAHGWMQSQAATELGLSQADVSRITRGVLKNYSVDRLMRLLGKLDYSVSIYIEGGTEPPERILVSRA